MKKFTTILIGTFIALTLTTSCKKKNITPDVPTPNPIDTVDTPNPIDTSDNVIRSIFGDGTNGTIDTTHNVIMDSVLGIFPHSDWWEFNDFFEPLFQGRGFRANHTTTQVTKNGVILDNTLQTHQIVSIALTGNNTQIEKRITDIDMVDNGKYDVFEICDGNNRQPQLYNTYSWNDGNPKFIFSGTSNYHLINNYENNINYKSDAMTRSNYMELKFLTQTKVYMTYSFTIGSDSYFVQSVMDKL